MRAKGKNKQLDHVPAAVVSSSCKNDLLAISIRPIGAMVVCAISAGLSNQKPLAAKELCHLAGSKQAQGSAYISLHCTELHCPLPHNAHSSLATVNEGHFAALENKDVPAAMLRGACKHPKSTNILQMGMHVGQDRTNVRHPGCGSP